MTNGYIGSEGKNIQELMWGGQGTNLGILLDRDGNPVLDENGDPISTPTDEQLAIPRGGTPTLGGSGGSGGGRPWRLLETSVPEASGIGSLTAEDFSKRLGVPSSAPVDGEYAAQKNAKASSGSSSGMGWYRSYGGGYSYGGGGGGGGYSSAYNPRIYNTARQVNGDRASGMQTRAPYKATTTYLRPAFYTKGSREAYRRQDI